MSTAGWVIIAAGVGAVGFLLYNSKKEEEAAQAAHVQELVDEFEENTELAFKNAMAKQSEGGSSFIESIPLVGDIYGLVTSA